MVVVCIIGEYGDGNDLTFQARYAGGYHRLSANLSGSGSLKLVGAGVDGGIVGGYPLGSPQLYGDNSAYHGKMYVTYSDNNRTEHNGTPFGFNSAAALGGALDTFQYDSLELDRYSMMCPAESMTFSTENRGIYGSGPFGFDVTNGVTFRVGVPVRMDDDMFKHGGGDLLLGGAISFGEDSSKTCYVREGGIGALADTAVAGLDIVFSNATKIVVSPDAALANGFTGSLSFEPADAATTVAVSVADGFSPSGDGPVTAVIATVPTSAGAPSSRTSSRGKGASPSRTPSCRPTSTRPATNCSSPTTGSPPTVRGDEKGFCDIPLPEARRARFVRFSFECRPNAMTELDEIWIFGKLPKALFLHDNSPNLL